MSGSRSAVDTLNKELLKVSLMGEFHRPLQHLLMLASIPPIARAMTRLPTWAPAGQNGRHVHNGTVLGPAFGITSLPEGDLESIMEGGMQAWLAQQAQEPQPNVAVTVFGEAESRAAEVSSVLHGVATVTQPAAQLTVSEQYVKAMRSVTFFSTVYG